MPGLRIFISRITRYDPICGFARSDDRSFGTRSFFPSDGRLCMSRVRRSIYPCFIPNVPDMRSDVSNPGRGRSYLRRLCNPPSFVFRRAVCRYIRRRTDAPDSRCQVPTPASADPAAWAIAFLRLPALLCRKTDHDGASRTAAPVTHAASGLQSIADAAQRLAKNEPVA